MFGETPVELRSLVSGQFERRLWVTISQTHPGEKRILGLFQRGDSLFPGDGWKVLEEFGQRLAGLDVVDERLERDPGADKDRRATHDVRVAVDDGTFVAHGRATWMPARMARGRPVVRIGVRPTS